MLVDGNTLTDNDTISADVCIIGAGAAGLTLALELGEAGISVLLVEGGGLEESDAQQDLYRGQMVGIDSFKLHKFRMRIFGGSTQHWAGWTMRLQPEDFEVREYTANSGWPFGIDELNPYYDRAARRVEIGNAPWDIGAVADDAGFAQLPSPSGRMTTRYYKYSPPTRFGQKYRAEVEGSPTIVAYTNTSAVNIVTNDTQTEVARIELQVLDGPRVQVEAGRYVLAMGGSRTRACYWPHAARAPRGWPTKAVP